MAPAACRRSRAGRGAGGTAGTAAAQQDAGHHCAAHGGEHADQPARHIVYKVDMTRIVRLREREKARFEQQHGVKLTYMPFIARRRLRRWKISHRQRIAGGWGHSIPPEHSSGHCGGVGVGADCAGGEAGRGARLCGLARAIADLAHGRARRSCCLTRHRVHVHADNSGIFGEEFGTPIINQPESRFWLSVACARSDSNDRRRWQDTIAIRSVQYFCLGFDHRTIDGADAGKFMGAFKQALEGWTSRSSKDLLDRRGLLRSIQQTVVSLLARRLPRVVCAYEPGMAFGVFYGEVAASVEGVVERGGDIGSGATARAWRVGVRTVM